MSDRPPRAARRRWPGRVTALILRGPGGETRIACDTVILAVGTIPLIELLDSATCRIGYDPDRGGHVPVLDPAGRTTVAAISAAGDCAGIWPAKSRDPGIAATEGRRAALIESGPAAPAAAYDPATYRLDWVRSAVLGAGSDPCVCQCEDVTAREILEIRPPRYLDAKPRLRNDTDLASLLGNGPPNPDQVKRLTRAGMGLCQGRRCRDQVAALLAIASDRPLGEIPLATHRAPVRPIPLSRAAPTGEDPGVREHWDVWFGMKSQYRAHWDLPAKYTAASRNDGTRGSE